MEKTIKTEVEKVVDDFSGLGIDRQILGMLQKINITVPTPIQKKSIPVALAAQDLIGVAQTGTGKTLAFGIPMVQRLLTMSGRGLILLPTRELAMQVEETLKMMGKFFNLKTACLIGGENIQRQFMTLRQAPRIIIATPGRLIDHLKRRTVRLGDIKILVLDEADMMFDLGFAPQIEEILNQVPAFHQTMLFSATMPATIMKLATKHMAMPVHIEVAPQGTTAENVDQEIYIVKKEDKQKHLAQILNDYKGSVLIFVRTKYGAKSLTRNLNNAGHLAAEIHSNLSFAQRKQALFGFKMKKYRILVATDIAARGIDVTNIELVINYDLPDNSEDYVHRIGRTARAGLKGKAISLATPDQRQDIVKIERLIKKNLVLTKFAELDAVTTFHSRSRFQRGGGGNRPQHSNNRFRRR